MCLPSGRTFFDFLCNKLAMFLEKSRFFRVGQGHKHKKIFF